MAKFFFFASSLVAANQEIINGPDLSQYAQDNLISFTIVDVQPVSIIQNDAPDVDADKYEPVQNACSNPCWEVADDGITCVPAADKVKTTCGGNTMTMIIDECVLDSHDLQGTDLKKMRFISTFANADAKVNMWLASSYP